MNTRNHDLATLEESRDRSESDSGHEHRGALLESIYEQSKDPTLERMRKELQKWIIKGLEQVPESGAPNMEQQRIMAESEINILRMESAIKKYVNSPVFQQNIASKVAKTSRKEAEVLLKREL